MTSLTAKTVVKAYFTVVLLLAVLASPLPQLGIALVLLVIQLYSVYRPLRASLDLVLVVGSLVFAPLALEALAGQVFSVLFMVPAVFLLDQSLRDNASTQRFVFARVGMGATDVLRILGAGLLLVFGASVVVWNLTLVLTVAILIGYLAVMSAFVFFRVPRNALHEEKTWSRIVVGDTVAEVVNLKSEAGIPVIVSLQPVDSWVKVEPSNFILPIQGKIEAALRFSPPLSGPSKIQLQALIVDPRGLIQTNQILEPVDLHIIPRAKYAKWLANKYLERTASGMGAAASISTARSNKAARTGVEFYGSRQYQPGDRMKDLDWKHTYLLGELIVKEFAGDQGQTAILAVDLTAKDATEADKLAYDFVMAALTFATESLPTALAVYNQSEVLAAMAPMNPREALKKALELTGKITIVERSEKVLQVAQMLRLRRSIGQLGQVEADSAQKLLDVLNLEYEANVKAALEHPAGRALAKIVEITPPPATITVVCSPSGNEEGLSVTLQRLKEKGYSTVLVG
jgi:hypothetical protein